MKSSPFILSAVLHLIIATAIWCGSGTKPAVRPAVLYVDLAAIGADQPQATPEQQVEPGEPEPAAPREQDNQPQPDIEPDPAVEPDPADQPEPAQPVPAAGELGTAQAGEPGKAQPQPQQAQAASEISRAFAGAWRAQEMMYNTRRYLQVAGLAMREVMEGKLALADRERLNGARVQIVASYDDGAAPAFSVKTEDKELSALLEDQKAWARVPSPKECKVQYRKVAFMVSLERGTVQVGLSPQ